MESERKHLWEIDHPYYCTEGNYFSRGCHEDFESWDDYISEFNDEDDDMNFIYRWDAVTGKAYWLEPEQIELRLYLMLQRKAVCVSRYVKITKEDEPEVIEYLKKKWKRMTEVWEGVKI